MKKLLHVRVGGIFLKWRAYRTCWKHNNRELRASKKKKEKKKLSGKEMEVNQLPINKLFS